MSFPHRPTFAFCAAVKSARDPTRASVWGRPGEGGVVGEQHNPNFGFITFFPAALHPGVTVLTTVRAKL